MQELKWLKSAKKRKVSILEKHRSKIKEFYDAGYHVDAIVEYLEKFENIKVTPRLVYENLKK